MATCSGCAQSCKGGCIANGKSTNSGNRRDYSSGTSNCNGTCWARCGGGCSAESANTAPDGKNYNDKYGSGDCWCGHDCAGCGGCSGGCSGCGGSCGGCGGACGGSCSGTCSNGCSYTCTGDCKGYCKGTCSDGCLGSCSTACSGECSHLCNIGCQSNAALEAYQHLTKYLNSSTKEFTYDEHLIEDKIVLDWLDAIDMHHLFKMIQEEGRRRVLKKTGYFSGNDEHEPTEAQTLTRAEEVLIGIRDEKGRLVEVKAGDLVDDDYHIKRLVNMYADNTGKSLSLSVGGTSVSEGKLIHKSIGTKLIESALARYREKIAVHTTSAGTGKQTIEDGK